MAGDSWVRDVWGMVLSSFSPETRCLESPHRKRKPDDMCTAYFGGKGDFGAQAYDSVSYMYIFSFYK